MDIINKKINELIPYENNPRNNDDAIEYVANSIREFGFMQPIVIDSQGVIVAGHTRYKASKKLGLKEVPCLIADQLTEEQVNAYRLADNKVSEVATWNDDLLKVELDNIDFDMSVFGFNDFNEEIEDDKTEPIKENERQRTMNGYNLDEFDEYRADGFYQMPIIKKTKYVPEELIGFNYVKSTEPRSGCGVHFFIDDYQFERIWNSPYQYMDKLLDYDCILTPDFSLYSDMPMAMKIWNVYRSRLIGQILQDMGGVVIPTLSWAEKETFEFCFDGIEQGGTVAVSTIGVKRNDENKQVWIDGMDEAMRKLKPSTVIVYGGDIGYKFDCEVKYIENAVTERLAVLNGR